MALKFIWTPQAIKGFNSVVDYLEAKWTAKRNLELRDKKQHIT
ncbi:hypothetical protein SGQ83_15625 [Flavobacterium sp. Fl-318]|uniref:Type II toxin-antitoxin system RelE/ParE family toxin n=1 Tax=Flavobacterium cupriresistens TaxID=2893885 RepID=A0ABU4RDX7_9FLAO|nr:MULTISPECIES: hypothetical protein [unclassified Flavobacterium]MDX6190789.1 hypothetical protein [Flavobacterium sp. Fl-318]